MRKSLVEIFVIFVFYKESGIEIIIVFIINIYLVLKMC